MISAQRRTGNGKERFFIGGCGAADWNGMDHFRHGTERSGMEGMDFGNGMDFLAAAAAATAAAIPSLWNGTEWVFMELNYFRNGMERISRN